MTQRGATLVELLIAIAMIVSIMTMLSLTFPKISANMTNHRRRWLASNFATSRLNELSSQPYEWVPLNAITDFGGTANCDCSAVDMATIPATDAVLVDGGVSYQRKICINLVNPPDAAGNWPVPRSQCPDNPITAATDQGVKNIRVQVFWVVGGKPYNFDLQGMVAR